MYSELTIAQKMARNFHFPELTIAQKLARGIHLSELEETALERNDGDADYADLDLAFLEWWDEH